MKTIRYFICAAILLFNMAAVWALDIAPSQGISLFQISYTGFQNGSNTATGMIEVNANLLRQTTGFTSGYVNMATSKGWVVKNLPVFDESKYPYSKISTYFDLGVQAGTASVQTTVAIQVSAAPVNSFAVSPRTDFPVAARTMSIGGIPAATGATRAAAVAAPPAPPNLNDILFGDQSRNDTVTQFDHPNIEAAVNQCMPASVANSLQYLKDTQGLQLPHENKPGLKGDDSLVGQLDAAMNRTATSRTSGQGTWGLSGKLSYLAANGLAERVVVTHWGDEGGTNSGSGNVSSTASGVTATSTGKGANVDFDAVLESLRGGQDCEVIYSWPDGAHATDIVAAGRTGGVPWIVDGSDINQDSDSAGAGPGGFVFNYLNDPDNNKKLNLSGTNQEIVEVICEKYVPPPARTTVTEFRDPAGHLCCVTPPPATINVVISGGTLTLSGSASWLPMTGTISADGAFSLSSSSTVAGFSNVSSTFSGAASGGTYKGTITIGTKGELYGVPLAFDVTIAATPQPATPAVRVNGFRHDFHAYATDQPLKISLSMLAGAMAGKSGDWWIVTGTAGSLYYLDISTVTWRSGLMPSYTGPLVDFPYIGLPLASMPSGSYDIFFIYDSVPNGTLDIDSLVYDKIHLLVD